MTHEYAEWQVAELARLGLTDPQRAERALNAVWAAMPGLYEELARSAGIPCDDGPETDVASFALVETGGGSVARLADSRIAVWEIVREHRRSGSVEQLIIAFPSVERDELQAAIDYASRNAQEIDMLIERYESMLEQRRAQYPYAR